MDARTHEGLSPTLPAARFYPPRPGFQMIDEAARAVNNQRMTVKNFHLLTTTLAPANPLISAPRWFWIHEVGVDKELAKARRLEQIERARDAASVKLKKSRRR